MPVLGAAAGAAVGSYDITATFTFTNGAESNYNVQLKTAVKGLVVVYRWDGFLQPINDTAHDLGLMSKFKAGQTIPAKFVLKNAAGAVVQQTGIPTFTRTGLLGACDSIAALENPELVSADVVPQYNWDGSQYHYNWSTKGLTAGRIASSPTLRMARPARWTSASRSRRGHRPQDDGSGCMV